MRCYDESPVVEFGQSCVRRGNLSSCDAIDFRECPRKPEFGPLGQELEHPAARKREIDIEPEFGCGAGRSSSSGKPEKAQAQGKGVYVVEYLKGETADRVKKQARRDGFVASSRADRLLKQAAEE